MRHRIEVLHGANFDMLGARPAEHYGSLTLAELEFKIDGFAEQLGLEVSTFQTNSEREFIERLHRAREVDDGLILNPGAWTHYSWAIRDALEVSGLPAVEVHLSDLATREQWRQFSVIRELCFATIAGQGVDGYREALVVLAERLEQDGGV